MLLLSSTYTTGLEGWGGNSCSLMLFFISEPSVQALQDTNYPKLLLSVSCQCLCRMRWWWQPCSQRAFVSIMQTLLQIAWDFCWQSDHLWKEACLLIPSRIFCSSYLKVKRMGGWRACPSSVDGGVGSLEECALSTLMLQDISSDLQAPEMSPEHLQVCWLQAGRSAQ